MRKHEDLIVLVIQTAVKSNHISTINVKKLTAQHEFVDVLLLDIALLSDQSQRKTLTRSLSYVAWINEWLFEAPRKKVVLQYCLKRRRKSDRF